MLRLVAALAVFLGLATVTPAGAQAFPVTVEHALGETVIPAEPKRIVSLGYVDHDYLYALGVAPIGVRDWGYGYAYATGPWAEAARMAVGAEPEVHPDSEVSLERVLAQQPDLILAIYEGLDPALYAELSKIAPVVAHVKDFPLWGAPWQENLRLIDRAVHGNTQKAESVIADIDAKTAAARAAYPILEGKTGTNAYYNPERGFILWSSSDTASRFLLSFGLVYPQNLDKRADGDGRILISPENMALLDADVIVWPIDDPADERQQMIEALPLYNSVRLGSEGRSVWLDDGEGVYSAALSFQSPLSIPFLIDILPPMLAAAVDGDPATVPTAPAN